MPLEASWDGDMGWTSQNQMSRQISDNLASVLLLLTGLDWKRRQRHGPREPVLSYLVLSRVWESLKCRIARRPFGLSTLIVTQQYGTEYGIHYILVDPRLLNC